MLEEKGITCDVCNKHVEADPAINNGNITGEFTGERHKEGWKILHIPPSGRETHCPDCLGNEGEEHF